MDWSDLEVAAEPANSAFTPNALLGHVVMLLRRETKSLPFTDTPRAPHYSGLATKAMQVTDLIWTKHRHKPRDPEADVVKSMELVLDEVGKLFILGFERGPFEVLSEDRFQYAATVVCHSNGHWLTGTYTDRFTPTDEDAKDANATIQQDKDRLREFEVADPIEWLRTAATSRHKRQPWVHAAEKWASLRTAIENAVSSEPWRLTAATD